MIEKLLELQKFKRKEMTCKFCRHNWLEVSQSLEKIVCPSCGLPENFGEQFASLQEQIRKIEDMLKAKDIL